MANFNSVKSQQKVLFLADEIDCLGSRPEFKDLVTSLVVFMQEAR